MGKRSPVQDDMAQRCLTAGAEYYTWYDTDEDWETIKEVLSRGSKKATVAR
jgi:hypothetical protein